MKATKRFLAIILVLIMSLSVMGVSAYAEVIMLGPDSDEASEPVIAEPEYQAPAQPGVIILAPQNQEEEVIVEGTDSTGAYLMIIHDAVSGDDGTTVVNDASISAVLAAGTLTGTVTLKIQKSYSEAAEVDAFDGDYSIVDDYGCTVTAGATMDSLFKFANSGTISMRDLTLNGASKATTGLAITAGDFRLTDCVLKGFTSAIDFAGSTMTIDGGTYGPVTVSAGKATLQDGSFDTITVSDTGDLTIQGGTYGAISAVSGVTLAIRDGYFSKLPTGAGASGSISGGYFKVKPTATLLAANKKVVTVSNVSGYGYRVVPVAEVSGEDVLATINGVNATDIATDLAAATAPVTVVLRQNVALTGTTFDLSAAGDTVWDLNGYTLSGATFEVKNSANVTVKNGTLGNKVAVDGATLTLGAGAKLSAGIELGNASLLECEQSTASVAGTVTVLDDDSEARISAGSFGNILSGGAVTTIKKSVTGGTFGGNNQLESDFVDTGKGYTVTKSGTKYIVSLVGPTIKSGGKAISEYTYKKGSSAAQNMVFTTNLPVVSIDAYQDDGNANLSLFGTLENPADYTLSTDRKTVTIYGSGTNMADMYDDADVGAGRFTLRFTFDNEQTRDLVMNIAPEITVDPENYTHKTGDGKDMVFTCSDDFEDVYIMKPGSNDSIYIESSNMTKTTDANGNTVLTLKAAYLDTLGSGTHTVVFDFGHGGQFGMPMVINKASTAATTTKPTIVSSTGDTVPYASALLTNGLNFNVTPANNISSVAVDGLILTDGVHYTLSTAGVLNLKSNYLMSLAFGDHTVTVTNSYGSASMTFRTGPGLLPLNGINTHTKGGSNTLTYVATHPITSIAVAGTTIASTNYALSADGKTITFTAAFLNSLVVGDYSVTATVNTGDGYLRQVSNTMRIISQYAASSSPATGDNSNLGLWIGLMAAALVLIGVVVFILKKKPETVAESTKAPADKK